MAEKAQASVTAIYALSDCDGAIRYVGKANNPAARFLQHKANSKSGRTHLYAWMRKEIGAGREITWHVLEWVSVDAWEAAERRLIAEHRKSGKLVNLADGGDQPKRSDDPLERRLWLLKKELLRGIPTMPVEGRAELAVKILTAAKRWCAGDPAFARWVNGLGVLK